MKLTETALAGAFVLDLEPLEDERGFFARSFCQRELGARGLETNIVQSNLSYNRRRGTLRGLHYQTAPHEEAKFVSCIAGSVFDVIVNLRRGSPSYGRWSSVELSAATHRAVYVPKGFAHGFQTLADDTTVSYLMTEFFHAESAHGVRWNDPSLAIAWPLPDPTLSPRDAAFGALPPRE